MSAVPSSKHLKLKELTDDGITNSYNKFSHKGKLELQVMGYWKFIEGTLSVPPLVPQLKWTQKIRGPDETSTTVTIVITGNEMDVQKAIDDAVPWREGDLKALNAIIQAMPGTKLHLVQSAKTAKEAWESLKAEYCSVNMMRAAHLKSYILGYKFIDGYRMDNWQDDMQHMYQELHDVDDTTLLDDEFTCHLVRMMTISDHWRCLHSELLNKVHSMAPGTLMSSEILGKLRDEDEGIQASNDELSVLMTSQAKFLQSKSGSKYP
jgi:gag-polypeptide of LTR copia-type